MSTEIFYHPGGQSESWLDVLDDGTIRYHWELDGPACLRNGSPPIDEVLSLNVALARWPQYAQDIKRAITKGKESSHE
jgi:hypothetical protein